MCCMSQFFLFFFFSFFFSFFVWTTGDASWSRVCYQRGLPNLVFIKDSWKVNNYISYKISDIYWFTLVWYHTKFCCRFKIIVRFWNENFFSQSFFKACWRGIGGPLAKLGELVGAWWRPRRTHSSNTGPSAGLPSTTARHGDGRQATGPRAGEATAADIGRVSGTVAVAAAVPAPF